MYSIGYELTNTHTLTHTHKHRETSSLSKELGNGTKSSFKIDSFFFDKINNMTLQNCNSNALALLITKLGCKISALKHQPRFYHLGFWIWDLKVEIWYFEDVVMLGVGIRVMVIPANYVTLLHCLVMVIMSLFHKHKL